MLRELATTFFDRASWLEMGEADRELCRTNDDAFDAVIASLTARAQLMGLVEDLTEEQLAVGGVEGWIALPCEEALGALRSQTT
jgi:hypothetical protein